jgi:hypothetical protein
MAKQESSEGTQFSYENTEEERELATRLVMKQPGAEDLLEVLELA